MVFMGPGNEFPCGSFGAPDLTFGEGFGSRLFETCLPVSGGEFLNVGKSS